MRRSAPNRAGLAAVVIVAAAAAAAAPEDSERRGAYVFRAANCLGCHTDKAGKGEPLAGGRALRTPFGVFFSPNITPDTATGIGGWHKEDFRRALKHGLSPDRQAYYPVFPYPSFTHMAEGDVADLWAYLRTVPAVRRSNKPHEVRAPFGWRPGLRLWQALYLETGPQPSTPGRSEDWRRGRYLVTALGHCGECHTPRDRLGGPATGMAMAGSADAAKGKPVPNITPDQSTGIGAWSVKDIAFYLETGFRPDGDVAGGIMAEIIETSTRHLTPADRAAIATYLKALPPIRNKVARAS